MLKDAGQDVSDLGVGRRVHAVGLHAWSGLSLLVADLTNEPVQLVDGQAGPRLKVAGVLHLNRPLVA